MANPHLATTLETFEATVQRTKNRLIAIPARSQQRLGLVRRPNNHIVLYSVRPRGRGRWNHHLAYLTYDNEFAVPTDVTHIRPGAQVEIKIHRIIPDADALAGGGRPLNAGGALLRLAERAGDDEWIAGSTQVDELLYGRGHG
ncbi:MAG TPA: hypothetical protein VHO06_01900 [Polyangia bacterium]|nr:hypothetical protein [Polyangia bacterium]